jgi:hypothetical protein
MIELKFVSLVMARRSNSVTRIFGPGGRISEKDHTMTKARKRAFMRWERFMEREIYR